ncbi:hypothetical protein BX616_008794, partial [Lobosporangium transversale]
MADSFAQDTGNNATSTTNPGATTIVGGASTALGTGVKKPAATLGRPPGSTNEPRNKRKKYVFGKELKQLMYGFGDVPNPANDAVGVLEDMLIEYLTDT